MEHFGHYLKNRARKAGITMKFEGCSQEDIQEMMKAQKVKRLPRVFREYQEVLGNRGPLRSLRSGFWKCEDIKTMKDDFIEDIRINGFDYQLPDDAFLFWTHDLIRTLYFLTDNTDDNPPVFLIDEIDNYKSSLYRESLRDLYVEQLNSIIKHSINRSVNRQIDDD